MWKDLSLKVETGFGEFVQSVRPFLAWICVLSSLEFLINVKVRLHYFWDFGGGENNVRAVSKRRSSGNEQLESDSVAKPNPGAWTAALSLSSFPAWWMAAQSVNTLYHWGGWQGQEGQVNSEDVEGRQGGLGEAQGGKGGLGGWGRWPATWTRSRVWGSARPMFKCMVGFFS